MNLLKMIQTFYPDSNRGGFSVTNFNTVSVDGWYSGPGSAVGAPNSSHDWIVQHSNSETDADAAWQVARSCDSADRFERRKSGAAWGAWAAFPASQVGIADAGSYFTGATAELALQEIGAMLAALSVKLNEKTDYGVLSGLVVSAQDTPDLTLAVSGGVAYLADGTRYEPAAVAALAATAGDETHPRVDIVYLSAGGVVTYLAGTAAAEPVAPATPEGGLLLATVSIVAEATNIDSESIVDGRRILSTT